MTASNHTLTGIVIAAIIPNPLISLPLAFFAHFVLDALPHFGDHKNPTKSLDGLKYVLPIDISVALAILVSIAFLQPAHWPILIAGGILCASPDLMSIPIYIRHLRGQSQKSLKGLLKFHLWIQWGEFPWGIWVELAWLITFAIIALRLI